jgi:hypothetical protein
MIRDNRGAVLAVEKERGVWFISKSLGGKV